MVAAISFCPFFRCELYAYFRTTVNRKWKVGSVCVWDGNGGVEEPWVIFKARYHCGKDYSLINVVCALSALTRQAIFWSDLNR